MIRRLKAFGWFWRDFLAGDAPEIAFGVVVMLVVALSIPLTGVVAGILVFGGTGLLLSVSCWRARKQ